MTIFRFSPLLLAVLALQPSVVEGSVGMGADRIMTIGALDAKCRASERSETGRLDLASCLGYIVGVSAGAATLSAFTHDKPVICLSETDTADVLRQGFLDDSEKHPDLWEVPAATAVIISLGTLYPCLAK